MPVAVQITLPALVAAARREILEMAARARQLQARAMAALVAVQVQLPVAPAAIRRLPGATARTGHRIQAARAKVRAVVVEETRIPVATATAAMAVRAAAAEAEVLVQERAAMAKTALSS